MRTNQMKSLFDRNDPHFTTWIRVYDIDSDKSLESSSTIQPRAIPLYYATLRGFRDLAEYLIFSRPEEVNARGGYCKTPFYASLYKGQFSIARLLHGHGADVDARDDEGSTPLHEAAQSLCDCCSPSEPL